MPKGTVLLSAEKAGGGQRHAARHRRARLRQRTARSPARTATSSSSAPCSQWVQIDLGKPCTRSSAILAWHYHSQARVYRDVVVQVSDDKDFLKRRHHGLQQRPRQHRRPGRRQGQGIHRDRPRAGSDRSQGGQGPLRPAVLATATPRTT
ncbi:MAG: discoidin domain-containing protein [Ignavibacteriales bacterium]|nr:discoidin domain-containing protein [Ignavibacteriales bacterium]